MRKGRMIRFAFAVSLLLLSFSILNAQELLTYQKPEQLYRKAIELMDRNQFGAAFENFAAFIALQSQQDLRTIEAQYYLAFCSLNLFHSDAEKLISDFVAQYPTHPKAALANYELANFFHNEKNYKKSAGYFAKVDFSALGVEQQSTGRFRYGYCLFSQKSLKESLDQFNYLKTQGGQYGAAASYYAGFVEYGMSDFDNALTDLKRAEQSEAYAKVVPYLIANVYYKKKSYDELLAYTSSLKSAEQLTNGDDIALLSAEAYFKKKDYRSALAGYNQYLEGKEEMADKGVLLRAGYASYMHGQDARAIGYLKQSYTDKDSLGYYSAYYLGLLYLKQNQKPMALASFDIARKHLSHKQLVEEATFMYAKVSYDMARPDQAIAAFERLLIDFPGSSHTVEVKELLSQAYVNANNFNKAIEYIESLPTRSITVERAYQKATLLKGLDLFNKEDYQRSSDFFERSLKYPVDSDYVAEASFWNGEALSIYKKYNEALVSYLKVVELKDLSNSDLLRKARYGLGYCFYNLEQYDKALFNFSEFVNKSRKGQPNLADGMLRLADCYYVSKSYGEALASYKKAIALNSADTDYAHLRSGVVLGIQRQYGEALNELLYLIKNYPTSSLLDEAYFQKAQLEFEQGKYAAAVEDYSRLIGAYPSSKFVPYAYTRRAASYFNLKDYDKTSNDYISAIKSYPNHPAAKDVLLQLQESLSLAGRATEFDQYFDLIKQSSPDAKGIESVEFETAKNLYFNEDYTKAIVRLGSYITLYPQSPRLSDAKYYQAEAYYRTKELIKALAIYTDLSADPTFAFSNRVVGRMAEIEFKTGKYTQAIQHFEKLARVASNKKEQYNAWNGLMESHYLLTHYDSSRKYAEVILESGSVNAGASNKASLFLGKIAKAKGDFETAKDEFLNAVNAAQDEYGAEAKYELANIFYQSKDYKQCYATLVSLNTDFASYTDWVGKSYLLLADNYLAQDDTFNAKVALKSLVSNFPKEDVKNQARERLRKIEAAELKKTESIKADTVENEK
ncbi:MAG: tetratricopeptide repeat protein [Cytophagales bacterium]